MARLTPRLLDGTRLDLDVSDAEAGMIRRGPGWKATVTDRRTGKRYRVVSAPCGLPHCYCDAIAVLLNGPIGLVGGTKRRS